MIITITMIKCYYDHSSHCLFRILCYRKEMVQVVHTHYEHCGPCRSWSIGRQPTENFVIIRVVGCYYFSPSQRLPVLWPVSNYTSWWQRHNAEQHKSAANLQTKPIDLACESSIIHTSHRHFVLLILLRYSFYRPTEVRRPHSLWSTSLTL